MSSPDVVPQRRLRSSSAHQRSVTPSRFTSPPPPLSSPLSPSHPAKRRRLTLLPQTAQPNGGGGSEAEARYADDSALLKPSPIRRTYICKQCTFNSTNPREFLYHQKENHGLKQSIKECPYCTYATIYTHKLLRHMTLVHKNLMGAKGSSASIPPSIAKLAATPLSPPRSNASALSTMYPGSISPSRLPPPSVVSNKHVSNKSQMILPPDLEMIPMSQSRGANSLLRQPPSKNNVSMIVVPKFKPSTNHSAKAINEALAANRDRSPAKNAAGNAGSSLQMEKCSFCTFKSMNKILIERHEKVNHFKKKFYRCTKCSYITNVRSRYTKHVRYHTMPYIKCELCDFSTPYKWNLDRHRKNHLEEPEGVGSNDGSSSMYRCHLCTFHTLTKQSLSGHLMNHHAEGGGRKRRRPIEEGGFYSESDFPRDLSRNADAKDYEGENEEDEEEDDEEAEHNENGLDEEEYENMNGKHGGEEVGEIEIASATNSDVRKSSRADKLNNSGDKQQIGMVQCDLCPYKAKWISEVDRHRRVHANEKPFECGKCPFSTRWKGDLTRHLSKYHPEVPDIVENIDMLLDQSMQVGGAEELEVYNQEQSKQMQQRGVSMISSIGPTMGARKTNNDKVSPFKKSPQIDYKVLGQLIKGQSMKQKITAPVQLSASVQLIPTNSSQSSEKRPLVEEKRLATVPDEGPIIRKKYQCPHCSLLVSTASGLGVHLQHHVKAYACSECNFKGEETEVVSHLKRAITMKDHKHQAAIVTKIKNQSVVQEKTENFEKYAIYETVNIVKKVTNGNGTNGDANSVLSRKVLAQTNKRNDLNSLSKVNAGKKSGSNVIYKCKYCEFRDPNRKTILRHLQVHTANKPFWCGICGQSSNSKNTILRHCQVRHNVSGPIIQRDTASLQNKSGGKEAKEGLEGKAKEGEKQEEDPGFVIVEDDQEQQKLQQDVLLRHNSLETNGGSNRSGKKHRCPICPYRCRKVFDLRIHSYMHKPHKESEYKCSYCPFYTSLKGSLLNHIKLHTDYSGYSSSDSIPPLEKTNSASKPNISNSYTNNSFAYSDNSFDSSAKKAKSESQEMKSGSSSSVKRFICEQCPYSTNSHTTYFYHRQFHRPSKSAVFKCSVCSYSVSKLHLLHQHEKVHDETNHSAPVSPRRTENREFSLALTPTPPPPSLTPPPLSPSSNKMGRRNDQSVPTLPRVWVHRDGVFKKMFKCRHCPHVSKKRTVIFEHEKMHKLREAPGSKANYHCHLCNYSCMNGGILTSHMRVHKAQNSSNFYISDTLDEDLPPAKSRWTSTPKATARKMINAGKESSVSSSSVKRSLEEEDEMEEEGELEEVTKNDVQLPVEKRRQGKVSYACAYCPARFNTQIKKSVHAKFHGVNLKYKCAYCNYSANHRPHLHRHAVVHTSNYKKNIQSVNDTSVSSNNTSKTAVTEINTAMNSSNVASTNLSQISPGGSSVGTPEGKVYTCTQCPAVFLKESTLQHHLKMHEGNAKYRCEQCTYSVFSYSNLVRHARVHGVELPADAPDLNTSMRSESSLSEVKKGDLEDETATFKCSKCPAVFDKKSGYDVHAGLHGSRQWFKCDRCDYSVKYEANLIRHRHLHDVHDERKAEDNNSSMLVNESDIPHGEMNESGASNTSAREMEHEPIMFRNGMRGGDDTDSTGVKKLYQCPKCPYSHYSLNSVKMHLQRHISGSSEARCPHCDYGTNMQSFLREHIKLHFDPTRLKQVEAFAHWEELEVWVRSGVHKTLIYRYALGETEFSENDYRTELVEPASEVVAETKKNSSSKVQEQNVVEMTNGGQETSPKEAPEVNLSEEKEREEEPEPKEKEVEPSSEPIEAEMSVEEEDEEEEDVSKRAVCFSPCPAANNMVDEEDEEMEMEDEEEEAVVESEAEISKVVENGKKAEEEDSDKDKEEEVTEMEVDSGEKIELEKSSEEMAPMLVVPEAVVLPQVVTEGKVVLEEESEQGDVPEEVVRVETPIQEVEIEGKEEVVKAGTESPTAIVVPEPQEISKETVEKVEATEEEAIVDVCSEESGETTPLLTVPASSEANVAADNLVEIMATDDTGTVIEEGTVSMDEMMTNDGLALNETCTPV